MKYGYIKTFHAEDRAAQKRIYDRLMEYGAIKIIVDNAKHELLPDLLNGLKPGDSLYIWDLFHLSNDAVEVKKIIKRLRENDIVFFIRGAHIDWNSTFVKYDLEWMIETHVERKRAIQWEMEKLQRFKKEHGIADHRKDDKHG